MSIKTELEKLKTADIYSLILFVLYRVRDTEEYSALSELAYVLDKDNLLNLCEYFGGLTIRIPTIDELESLINSLLLYQYIDIDGLSYKEAVKRIGFDSSQLRQVKKDYTLISDMLSKYTIAR